MRIVFTGGKFLGEFIVLDDSDNIIDRRAVKAEFHTMDQAAGLADRLHELKGQIESGQIPTQGNIPAATAGVEEVTA